MSRSLAPALVTADDIMEFTLDCEPCDARGRTAFIERYLHGEIYRARPDVMAVAHGHSPSVIPFGLVVDADARDVSQRRISRLRRAGLRHSRRRSARPTSSSTAPRGERRSPRRSATKRSSCCARMASSRWGRACRRPCSARSSRRSARACSCRPRRSAGPSRRSIDEEGRKADAINLATVGRSWEFWKRRVMS